MSHIKRFEHKRAARFDVTDFGAIGDSEADDSKAINDAISAAESADGGTVEFPKGTYKCIAIRPKNYVSLEGHGWGESILKGFNNNTNNAIIDGDGFFSQDNPLTEFNMYNLEIDGSLMNRAGYHYNRKGIGNQWLKNSVFNNIFIHDTPATAFGTDYTLNVYFNGCLAKDCGTKGIIGNGVGSNGFGIGVSDATQVVVFSSCQAIGVANNGFTLEAQKTKGKGYATIIDCYTERCGNAGYSNSGSQGVTIISCTDSNSKYGVYVSSNASQSGDQTIVSGCQFIRQTSHGVYSDFPLNVDLQVKDCLFDACNGSGIKNIGSYASFSNNTFKACGEAAILCQPGNNAVGKGYLISDNLILKNRSTGITIDSRAKKMIGLLVKGNLIQDSEGIAIDVICKPDDTDGGFEYAALEGNVLAGGVTPKLQVCGTSRGLAIQNNIG